MQDSTVYAVGINTYGQLGLGHTKDSKSVVPVTCLRGSPIVFIACGAYHSVIISKSGFVESQGRNLCYIFLYTHMQRVPEIITQKENCIL